MVTAKCPDGWMPSIDDTCLKVFTSPLSWHKAQDSCRKEGGELVTMERKAKEYFVKGWLMSLGKLLQYFTLLPGALTADDLMLYLHCPGFLTSIQ